MFGYLCNTHSYAYCNKNESFPKRERKKRRCKKTSIASELQGFIRLIQHPMSMAGYHWLQQVLHKSHHIVQLPTNAKKAFYTQIKDYVCPHIYYIYFTLAFINKVHLLYISCSSLQISMLLHSKSLSGKKNNPTNQTKLTTLLWRNYKINDKLIPIDIIGYFWPAISLDTISHRFTINEMVSQFYSCIINFSHVTNTLHKEKPIRFLLKTSCSDRRVQCR